MKPSDKKRIFHTWLNNIVINIGDVNFRIEIACALKDQTATIWSPNRSGVVTDGSRDHVRIGTIGVHDPNVGIAVL